jgi:hypothetical protein
MSKATRLLANHRGYPANVSPSANPAKRLNTRFLRFFALVGLLFLSTQNSPAYSVLTHEQIVDLMWKDEIRPMLQARYPNATQEDLRKAHAYAYGGSLIQDIGYYPFGNRFFSDLVHYVRSGDFVTNMLDEADDLNEYAFALGALAHYASDVAGHPLVNIAVAENFPKLRAKFGSSVTYVDSPTAHIRTEFGFDVVQVARGHFTTQGFHDFIGFEVSKPLLDRAFLKTYGLHIEEVFSNLDLAIGTFRHVVSGLIPHMTKVAIVLKKDQIIHDDPEHDASTIKKRFLYHLKRSEYRREWGRQYQQPGFGTRLLAFFISILPKVGPLKSLDVKMPTPATELLYMKSVNNSADQYDIALRKEATNSLKLDNKDFDTGEETKAGEYSLTDLTYADLVNRLAEHQFAHIEPELRANILSFYQDPHPPAFAAKDPGKWKKTQNSLTQLETLPTLTAAGTQ